MKVRAQFAFVFNLDKCIGCHTCSVTCKNVWTNRKGVEYAWFNNVESKPGIGYPKQWENQEIWRGGWELKDGKLQLKSGSKLDRLLNIFANPDMPEIDDYYEPFTFDYAHLQNAPLSEAAPTARPVSQITGEKMDKITWGPNWEDDLAGEFDKRGQGQQHAQPREGDLRAVREHLPHVSAAHLQPLPQPGLRGGLPVRLASTSARKTASCWSTRTSAAAGACASSSCPYKKVFYNWESGKAEKCIGCYPRVESGMPTVCSESCVGRIRYNGIMLYDADKIEALASVPNEQDLYQAQLDIFLDPNDPEGDRAGPHRRHPRRLDRGRAQVADLQDGGGMEDRLPDAPRVPHAADGLVCAAAVAGAVAHRPGRAVVRSGQRRSRRWKTCACR